MKYIIFSILSLSIVGCTASISQTDNPQTKITNTEEKKTITTQEETENSKQDNPSQELNFHNLWFEVPQNWSYDNWGINVNESEIINTQNGDVITFSKIKAEKYESFSSKFGSFLLEFSQEKNCWITSSEFKEEECTSVIKNILNKGNSEDFSVFSGNKRWKTYIITSLPGYSDGTYNFIEINISGTGETQTLEIILDSIDHRLEWPANQSLK